MRNCPINTSRIAIIFALIMSLCVITPGWAVEPSEVLKDPALEARARSLSAELRCLVCQNQSIDDSNAQLAKDLRILVRERLSAGDSDKEVMDFIVARYGEFVLLRPRFGLHTFILWFGPLFILLLAGYGFFRMRSGVASYSLEQTPDLDAAEKRQIEKILQDAKRVKDDTQKSE